MTSWRIMASVLSVEDLYLSKGKASYLPFSWKGKTSLVSMRVQGRLPSHTKLRTFPDFIFSLKVNGTQIDHNYTPFLAFTYSLFSQYFYKPCSLWKETAASKYCNATTKSVTALKMFKWRNIFCKTVYNSGMPHRTHVLNPLSLFIDFIKCKFHWKYLVPLCLFLFLFFLSVFFFLFLKECHSVTVIYCSKRQYFLLIFRDTGSTSEMGGGVLREKSDMISY